MNEEELERVRRDSGLEKVVQVTDEMEEVERTKDGYVKRFSARYTTVRS